MALVPTGRISCGGWDSTAISCENTQGGLTAVGRPRLRRKLKQAGEIERIALELLTQRGFAMVTADQIAGAADISRRTFFRYFPSKEDILLGDRGSKRPWRRRWSGWPRTCL